MPRAFAVALAAAAVAAAGAARAATVEIRDAVARVTVVPEDRSDVRVEILATNPRLPLEVRTVGSDTVIDGGLAHRIWSCRGGPDRPRAWVRGVGGVEGRAIPQVVVHAPRDVAISSNGAVFGSVGRSASVRLRGSGCDSWTLANVQGPVSIEESGKGSVRMGSVGRLDLRLSGAADLHAVSVREGMSAQLSGTGGVHVEELAGPMEAQVSGMGHVHVAGGHASHVRAQISGMGGVEFGGTAESLEAAVSGVGSVHVRQVTGQVTKSVSGIGKITIDEQRS